MISFKNDVEGAGNLLQAVCHGASVSAGWWKEYEDMPEQYKPYWIGTKLALCHSEVSEALEGHRKGLMDEKLTHRSAIEVELADVLIRVFDLAGGLGLDVGGALAEKMDYNSTRADHKPEARAAKGGKSY